MPAGITSWSDAGSVQITDARQNPVVVASGNMTTVTNTKSGAPLPTSMASITYTRPSTDSYPIVAIRPSAQTMFYGIDTTGGLTWKWEYLSNQAVGTSIPYWIFDRKSTIASSQLFEIYDSAGTRTFSLAEKWLRMRAIISGDMDVAAWTEDHTYDTGRTYAAAFCRWSESARYRVRDDETDIYGLGIHGITNGVRSSAVPIYTAAGDATPSPFLLRQVLVMDVTNY